MNISLVLLIALAAATVAASAWCKVLSRNEDGYLHTGDASASVISKQAELGQSINKAENLRRMLLWATVVWGVIVACLFLMAQWNAGSGLTP